MTAEELEQLHRALNAFMTAAGAPTNDPIETGGGSGR